MIGYFTKEQENARKEQLKGYYTDEKELEQNTTSPMKLYPNLKLVPVSLVRRPYIFLWWALIIVLAFALLLILGWVGLMLSVLCGVLLFKKVLYMPRDSKGGYKKLVKEVDYLSGERGFRQLCIFLKDMKFGVIKLWSCCVVIPPTYSFMEWEIYGKILRVKKDGRAFLIDIYGNEV